MKSFSHTVLLTSCTNNTNNAMLLHRKNLAFIMSNRRRSGISRPAVCGQCCHYRQMKVPPCLQKTRSPMYCPPMRRYLVVLSPGTYLPLLRDTAQRVQMRLQVSSVQLLHRIRSRFWFPSFSLKTVRICSKNNQLAKL